MKVVKKIGYTRIVFIGSVKAINTFTRIQKYYANRGFGIAIPKTEGTVEQLTARGVGTVVVHRAAENECEISFVEGALKSYFRTF